MIASTNSHGPFSPHALKVWAKLAFISAGEHCQTRGKRVKFKPSRHSSVVEQLIRNQQVRGSNPRAGSNEIKVVAEPANPIFIMGTNLGTIFA